MEDLFAGVDVSTQGQKIVIIDLEKRSVIYSDSINYDVDLPKYNTLNGVLKDTDFGVSESNPNMWIDSLHLLFERLRTSSDIIQSIKLIESKTKKNNAITINLALNYGSKEEIVDACRKFIFKKNEKVDIKNFQTKLYTKNIPDPDILIRTGGTRRLSNFLLWQLAYAEIFFIDKLWPDFNGNDFNKIINKFHKIKRNFGKI